MDHRDNTLDERVPALFEPDTLLPSQYSDRTRAHAVLDGERRLMVAVLEEAINTYVKMAGASDPVRRELFSDAEDWFASSDATWLYSFENICAVLDLDAGWVRRGLRARKAVARAGESRPTRTASPDVVHEVDEMRRASGE